MFEQHCNQFKLTETANLNYRVSHHLYKNPYYVSNNSEGIESN